MKIYTNKNIIANPEMYDKMRRRGLNSDIQQTLITDKQIREPDNFFDNIIIYDFQNLPNLFFGLSEKDILKEAYRVLKHSGLLIVQFHNVIPPQEDFALDFLANSFKKSAFYNEIDKEEVLRYFVESFDQKPEFIGFKEFYLGYIKKEVI